MNVRRGQLQHLHYWANPAPNNEGSMSHLFRPSFVLAGLVPGLAALVSVAACDLGGLGSAPPPAGAGGAGGGGVTTGTGGAGGDARPPMPPPDPTATPSLPPRAAFSGA